MEPVLFAVAAIDGLRLANEKLSALVDNGQEARRLQEGLGRHIAKPT